jgi:outer membrane immunogenic protein
MNTTLLRLLAGSMAGVFLLIGGAASAADLPTKKAPLAPAPVIVPWTWTGFYASLQGGYAWDGSIVFIGPWNKGFGDRGFFGGPNVGYNYQIGSFVIGAQGSYDFGNANGSAYAYPYSVSADIHGFGSLDGRAGVTWGPALFYGIGGWSIGDIEHSINPIWGYPNLSYSSWQSGWDVGGGIEWKFTNNISGFAEFRKYNWGTKGYSDIYYPSHAIQQTLDVVRIGLTYNFGGPTFGAAF